MLKITAAIIAALGLGFTATYMGLGGSCSDGGCPISRLFSSDAPAPAASGDCCVPGADCCTPPQGCCSEVKKPCCSGCESETKDIKAEVKKPDCCVPGAACCTPGAPCCEKK